MRLAALLPALVLSLPCEGAPSPTQAFDQATEFGRAANPGTARRLREASPRATVPGYAGTPAPAGQFGSPDLGGSAAARARACAAPRAPGAPADPSCAAIEFSQANPARRPGFTITPADPLLAAAGRITADPQRIAGHLAGTYSGCTVREVTTPEVVETHLCNEFRVVERQTCEKTLSVSVTDQGLNCTPGALITPDARIALIRPWVFVGATCADDIRFRWTYGYSECNGTNEGIHVTTSIPTEAPTRTTVDLGCGGQYVLEGSCPQGRCSYRVAAPERCDAWCGERCCEGHVPEDTLAGLSFVRPNRTHTISEQWINQCSAYEARLP